MDQDQVILEEMARRYQLWSEMYLDKKIVFDLQMAANIIWGSIVNNGKILIFGNGGSATQASHFAGELVGRFRRDRKAIPAIALTSDMAIITAQGNDSGFETVFSRQIQAYGNVQDIAVGFTTSDAFAEDAHSQNIFRAFQEAQRMGMASLGFFSARTKNLLSLVNHALIVPADDTSLIQDIHQTFIHIVCGLLEDNIAE